MKTPREFAHLVLYWDADKYQDQRHWPNCDRLTKLIATRDAEHAAETARLVAEAEARGREAGLREVEAVCNDRARDWQNTPSTTVMEETQLRRREMEASDIAAAIEALIVGKAEDGEAKGEP